MNTKALVTMTASIIAANAVLAADWTVSENTTLTADTTVDALTVEDGVTLDLNRYSLTCTSLAGTGTITSTSDDLTSPEAAGATPSAVTWDYAGTIIGSGSVTNLFDNDFTTYSDPHRLYTSTLYNQHFTICYDFGEDTVVNKYKIYNGWGGTNRSPYIWDFEGSNDNSSWTTLHSVEESKVADIWSKTRETKEFSFDNTDAYRYYRIVFKKTGTSAFEIKQLEYFNTNPGELHVNVADGEMENSTVAISGNVKVVKEGLGTFIPSKTGQTYTGGTEIVAGTVKAVTGGAGYKSAPLAFGPAGSKIIVSTNATSVGAFDVNGQTRYCGYDFVLNGGTIKNSATIAQNSGKLVEVSLTADSTFDFANYYGLYDPDNNAPILSLAGHTLTLQGSGGAIIENATATTSGNINAIGGNVQFWGRNETERQTDFRNVSLTLGIDAQMFTYNAPGGVLLGDLVCNTSSSDAGHNADSYKATTPKLYGTFKPNTDYFHGVELQDGATIDLSGRTTTLPLRGRRYADASASDTCLHTVTFAAPEEPAESITIYVKLGERDAHGKLISWDSIPSGVNFVSASGEKERSFLVTDRGLSLSAGLMIFVQ